MAKVVSASDASDRLGTLLDEVRLRDAAFVIERDGLPAAALVPVGLLDRFITGRGTGVGSDLNRQTGSTVGRRGNSGHSSEHEHAGGLHDEGSSRHDDDHAGNTGTVAVNVESQSERPIDRIAALRSMLAEPRGGERFEAVLERTFSNVRKQRRKQRRKQLRRSRNV